MPKCCHELIRNEWIRFASDEDDYPSNIADTIVQLDGWFSKEELLHLASHLVDVG